jgi:NAD(P)-dependent dehydrogenase (short-subunit alcohol dehydrogenase family)
MVKETIEKFGRVDILANIAAYTAVSMKPLHLTTVADWAPHIDITLKGSLFCARAVIPQMLKQKSGRIINMSSDHGGKMGAPMLALRAKGRGARLYQAIARNRPCGITVCVCEVPSAHPLCQGGESFPSAAEIASHRRQDSILIQSGNIPMRGWSRKSSRRRLSSWRLTRPDTSQGKISALMAG